MTTPFSEASAQAPSPLRAADPIGYRTDCPRCGKELQPVALDADTAPWLCNDCHRGFWSAELTDVARARYRPARHDWGLGTPAQALRRSVQTEWLAAHGRGTSLRPDQLRMVPRTVLECPLPPRTHPDFVAAVANELKARG